MPIKDFKATSFGKEIAGAGPINASRAHSIGIMIADKTEGPFKLEVEWIKAIAGNNQKIAVSTIAGQ